MPSATKQKPSKSKRPCIRISPDVHRELYEACGEPDGFGMGRLANRLIKDGLDRLKRSAS